MARLIGFASVFCGLLLCLWTVRAEQKTRFHLNNGDIVTGKVLEQRNNGSVLIQTAHGRLLLAKGAIRLKEKVVPKKGEPTGKKPPRKRRADNSIDKQTLAQIKASLMRIEQAINKEEPAALRSALGRAPGAAARDLRTLKKRLGLTRVALRASSGRTVGDRVRVTVTVEKMNGQGADRKNISGENFWFSRTPKGWQLVLRHVPLGRKLDALSQAEQATVNLLR